MPIQTSPTRVLFMCPHSAGKSLIAAAYLQDAAARLGLDVEVEIAGTDPDEDNMPNVVAALTNQGYEINWSPRLVGTDVVANADHLVSIGCDHSEIPTDRVITEWEVPMLSDDLEGSMAAIKNNVDTMVAALLR